jgi:acyl-coenzyme A thioesterase PaaI-like protein
MAESFKSRLSRWGFNWFPAYRSTGAHIDYIAADWREIRIRLPLSRRTRNYVGTIFGGSMYGAIDPLYMIMLIKILGSDFVVWDKAATIRFLRPGRSTLFATFLLTDDDLHAIRDQVARDGRSEPRLRVELKDGAGQVCASFEKVLSVRPRSGEPQGRGNRRNGPDPREPVQAARGGQPG